MTIPALASVPSYRPIARTSTRESTELIDVERTFDPQVSLVVWKRQISPAAAGSRLWPRTRCG
ncbi:MAG: hypothetical protein ACKO02_10805 [Cyanobium sp.]